MFIDLLKTENQFNIQNDSKSVSINAGGFLNA